MNTVSLILAIILSAASAIHVYWAAGGKTGLTAAIPHTEDRPAFVPSRVVTLVVAFALLGIAVLMLSLSHFRSALTEPLFTTARYAAILVGAVFGLRVVGDFKLVGIFKKIKGSRFATLDTYVYNPLCLSFSVAFFTLARPGSG